MNDRQAWAYLEMYRCARENVRAAAASHLREHGITEMAVASAAGVEKTSVRYWIQKHTEETEDGQ
jgi:hypothetical protein